MERYFKVEGNIIYPDDTMLTWGPFYYHSFEKGKEKMNDILKDITNWCNLRDPSLNIQAENIQHSFDNTQIIFTIKAWKDSKHLKKCNGIIELEDLFFEDDDSIGLNIN